MPAFLFTDIEGSTARWERDPAAMEAALRKHDALVRAAIESHGGIVFKTIGDAFCAAFDSVERAVTAAVDAQRALGAERWSEVGGLAVRMAVHSGEAERRDGDYFGPPLNRVSRMLALGHGGQILLSGTALDAAHGVESGLTFHNLGTMSLRGAALPERVYQIRAPGLDEDFPPLRELAAPPSNFPLQPTHLIGRFRDRSAVSAAVGAGRLVTVDGPGGIGKTRVALAAASDVRADYPDGAWFVDFAPLSDPGLVDSAVLTTIGGRSRSASSGKALIDFLRNRRTLLVFDNCEHVVTAAARTAAGLLAACPNVATLATSRSPLRVQGEREYRLGSLDDAAAAELFAERARAVRPEFVLDERTLPAVIDLCRRLDSVPLAIELAAARMRVMSLDELSHRLTLRALTSGARDRDPRQRTMHALIEWSYDLLEADERRTFRAVSVFAGGFTLTSACAVDGATDDWDTLDRLESLTEKSLVVADVGEGEQRYRLMESIREYARERLNGEDEEVATLDRHARTFREFSDLAYVEWDTQPGAGWLQRYALELDNLRVALQWSFEDEARLETAASLAASSAPLFMRLSLLREGVAWCERALANEGDVSANVGARLRYAASMLYHNLGMDDRALTCANEAAQIYERVGDERGLTRALSQVAYESAVRGNFLDAVRAAERALEKARTAGDRRLLAATLQRCAMVTESTDLPLTRERYREAIDIFRTLGREDEMARAMLWWADAEGVSGNPQAAVAIASEALEHCPPDLRVFLTNGLAGWYVALDDRSNALTMARESLRLAHDARHEVAELCASLYLAALSVGERPVPCAQFAGYLDAQLKRLDWTLAASDQTIAVALRERARTELGDERFANAVLEGTRWPEERASALALQL
ncbi:MAG TPA: adenylate/guanylate cyclase domain-containing protein [Candidatus Tumulicola sp.]